MIVGGVGNDLQWLGQRIDQLLSDRSAEPLILPVLADDSSYKKLIRQFELNDPERVVLCLAFAAVFKPSLLTPFALLFHKPDKKLNYGGIFIEEHAQFYPTVRTALFLLSGNDEELLNYYTCYFNGRQKLFTSGLLVKNPAGASANFLDSQLIFNDQFIPTILQGAPPLLDGDTGFPARRGKRTHTMRDVVLNETIVMELEKLRRFAKNMKKLWSLPESSYYRQNFICIFSGDPGTGKSHTAEAIGNELNLPVYKINFAQLVSKYIGETEKNLERVFDRFSGQPSILFFDEAESIFSKRTEVKDSHDKHSNNEQSFLLQKIEDYNGIVILATNVQNLTHYFDKAFQRRIRQIVNFSFPEYPERLRLWKNALRMPFRFEEALAERLAKDYQFSGGGIYNIVSEAVIEALDKDQELITFGILEPAIIDEFKKTGRRYEICPDEKVIQDPVKRYGPGYEQRKNF